MIGDIIATFAVNVTLRRRAAGTTTNGRHTLGAVTSSTIRAAVVPASGKDLLRLPEGSRTRETKRVFTTTALQLEPADEISYAGALYEVATVADWNDQGAYYDALMIRKVVQS